MSPSALTPTASLSMTVPRSQWPGATAGRSADIRPRATSSRPRSSGLPYPHDRGSRRQHARSVSELARQRPVNLKVDDLQVLQRVLAAQEQRDLIASALRRTHGQQAGIRPRPAGENEPASAGSRSSSSCSWNRANENGISRTSPVPGSNSSTNGSPYSSRVASTANCRPSQS
jgi:hypothetical protein